MNQDDQKGKFKITDRRSFTEDGDLRQSDAPEPENKDSGEPSERPDQKAEAGGQAPPAMDFSSFVISLATTAMVHLGEVPDPAGRKPQENVDAARQMVAILDMLKEKTAGNRTPEENRLLEEILYELRMKVLKKSNVIRL